jgi:hypothetical protein
VPEVADVLVVGARSARWISWLVRECESRPAEMSFENVRAETIVSADRLECVWALSQVPI